MPLKYFNYICMYVIYIYREYAFIPSIFKNKSSHHSILSLKLFLEYFVSKTFVSQRKESPYTTKYKVFQTKRDNVVLSRKLSACTMHGTYRMLKVPHLTK
jgi:hypothetical protein